MGIDSTIKSIRGAGMPYSKAEIKTIQRTNAVITDITKRSRLGKSVTYASDVDEMANDQITLGTYYKVVPRYY